MKLWIDEDLSPSLVHVGHDAGYQSTSVRDRGMLSSKDHALVRIVLDEEWVFVTNNAGDFLKRAEAELAFEPAQQVGTRPGLAAIGHIEARAADANETAEQFMVNCVIEVDDGGRCNDYPWPELVGLRNVAPLSKPVIAAGKAVRAAPRRARRRTACGGRSRRSVCG